MEAGEFLAVLGPSGSGKSTLMNIIGCLDVPTRGHYTLSGIEIANQDEQTLAHIRNKQIGFIFQSFFLMQKQTALENVKMPLIYAGVSEKEQNERAYAMLEKVGLADKALYYPNQMSGGQQQRVAIARAMCNNPTILLADEPTGALDQKTGRQVMDLFHALNEEGRTNHHDHPRQAYCGACKTHCPDSGWQYWGRRAGRCIVCQLLSKASKCLCRILRAIKCEPFSPRWVSLLVWQQSFP